eukprot:g5412.t1
MTLSASASAALRRVRNIGILAHIDAGKTTVTERMLYYAGMTRVIGSVDSGDTVMDFMPQERERGITINSAAISFQWGEHHVNLIDTPGHVDFTFEVERALRVLDGAVLIVDSVAGVQSQTETVWRQADSFSLPRFAFVNKMDRAGASLEHVGVTLQQKLGTTPLFCQLPVGLGDDGDTADDRFHGIVDLISMDRSIWLKDPSGADFVTDGEEGWASSNPELFENALSARETLVQLAADFDDTLAEVYLMSDSSRDVGTNDLWEALRRITDASKRAREGDPRAIVTLCGTAQRNRGVQPLMDAIPRLLPSPMEKDTGMVCSGIDARYAHASSSSAAKKKSRRAKTKSGNDGNSTSYSTQPDGMVTREGSPDEPLVALAFKVQHDPQRGDVVFVRVYSGTLRAKDRLLNTTLGMKSKTERAMRLLNVRADSVDEIESIQAGHIGAIVGLKSTRSGDTLCRVGEPNPLILEGMEPPPAVFTASVEVGNSSEKKEALHNALSILSREDPSLHVVLEDPETKQTLVSGMGELHLHIVLDRVKHQFKLAEATLGRMRVAYRETILGDVVDCAGTGKAEEDRMVGNNRRFAKITVVVEPLKKGIGEADATAVIEDGADLVMHNEIDLSAVSLPPDLESESASKEGDIDIPTPSSRNDASVSVGLRQAQIDSIKEGISSVLRSGPIAGYPISGVRISLDPKGLAFDDDSTPAACFVCAARATKRAFDDAHVSLLEPQMSVLVSSPSSFVGAVVADLSSALRSGLIVDVGLNVETGDDDKRDTIAAATQIKATAPLRGMIGYSTDLRSLTSGEASFSMSFDRYTPILQTKVVKAIQEEAREAHAKTEAQN